MDAAEIFKKLKLDDTAKNLIVNAPAEFSGILSDIPHDSIYQPSQKGLYDYIQVFATGLAELEGILSKLTDAGKYDCIFWICYPKGGSKIKSELKRDIIWGAFTIVNLRPVSQIAIDETWSALRGRPAEEVKSRKLL